MPHAAASLKGFKYLVDLGGQDDLRTTVLTSSLVGRVVRNGCRVGATDSLYAPCATPPATRMRRTDVARLAERSQLSSMTCPWSGTLSVCPSTVMSTSEFTSLRTEAILRMAPAPLLLTSYCPEAKSSFSSRET